MPKKQKSEFSRFSCRVSLKNKPIEIKYKFIFADPEINEDTIFVGEVHDLSTTGALIIGCIKNPKWVSQLASEAALLGCNLIIDEETYVKTLARVRWFKASDCATKCKMGLEFLQMDDDHTSILKRFLIRRLLSTSRLNRSQELLNPEYRSL